VLLSGQEDRRLAGELIAASADSLWVMSEATVVVVPVTAVASGQLAGYDPESGQVGGAVALGAISTISNGAFLILTAPMWLIGGSIAANSQGKLGSGNSRVVGPADPPTQDAVTRGSYAYHTCLAISDGGGW
jgi:hypothetical protein